MESGYAAPLDHINYIKIDTKYNIDHQSKKGMNRLQKFVLIFFSVTFIWMAEYITRNPEQGYGSLDYLEINDILRLKQTTKYLLLWTRNDYAPFNFLGEGNDVFIKNKCPFLNCFVTSRRDFFGGNLTQFDAIAFNGRNIRSFNLSDLPKVRYPHQKYIFFNMESSVNQPICNPMFDGFFNMTATYKLDSDIVMAYLLIRNRAGDEVGPRINMTWNEVYDDQFVANDKRKVAVWMASNCKTESKRENYVRKLKAELKAYGHTIDVYGACGNLKCPRGHSSCGRLPSEYYFYLSFENSIAEDYVTEKLLTALKNGALPIVLGGADYSRFLPLGSYLDAMKLNPKKLAATMSSLIKNQSAYNKFFRWKSQYTYHNPLEVEDVCRVCAALNDRTMMETSQAYERFREWWNPHYRRQCRGRN